MNKNKLTLEVIDLVNSTIDWEVEMHAEGMDILVMYYLENGDQWDQDPGQYFPETEEIIGEIWVNENGCSAYSSQVSTEKAIEELKSIGFKNFK